MSVAYLIDRLKSLVRVTGAVFAGWIALLVAGFALTQSASLARVSDPGVVSVFAALSSIAAYFWLASLLPSTIRSGTAQRRGSFHFLAGWLPRRSKRKVPSDRALHPGPSPHQVLSVPSLAPADYIKARYRLLMRQVHPDLVRHLSPEAQKEAHRRSIEIIAAYKSIRRHRAA